jgi:hypothetical protein
MGRYSLASGGAREVVGRKPRDFAQLQNREGG